MFYALSALVFIYPALVILGGVYDLMTMRIPNWISIALIVAFVPVALVVGLTWQETAMALGLAGLALIVGIALFAFRLLGGGDAKILAASTAWVGLSGLLPFLLITAVAGGALSLLLLLARKWVVLLPLSMPSWLERLTTPKGDVPYGVAIAIGAVLAFPYSQILLKLS